MTHVELQKLFKQAQADFMAWRREHAPTQAMIRRKMRAEKKS
jgi:hypothetical protein